MSDAPGWAAIGVSAVAIGIAGFSYFRQRDAVNQAKRSADAADRSATAEEQAAEVAKRLADRREVRWMIRPSPPNSSVHVVVNEGTDSAYLVNVYAPDGSSTGHQEVTPGSGVLMRYSPDYDSDAPKPVTVTWHNEPTSHSPEHSWQWPLHI